ncbi:hypothetical protein VP01_1193g4 [Puccinia sorghi]|uniref:Uncharacterized protein n=1 Tax=Puccinia sorghi TaxID=27349 RepID=A0A0L6VQS5_9BASI|nr:hypothetical protein VP01_1193g4 [Puccinia sorghi]
MENSSYLSGIALLYRQHGRWNKHTSSDRLGLDLLNKLTKDTTVMSPHGKYVENVGRLIILCFHKCETSCLRCHTSLHTSSCSPHCINVILYSPDWISSVKWLIFFMAPRVIIYMTLNEINFHPTNHGPLTHYEEQQAIPLHVLLCAPERSSSRPGKKLISSQMICIGEVKFQGKLTPRKAYIVREKLKENTKKIIKDGSSLEGNLITTLLQLAKNISIILKNHSTVTLIKITKKIYIQNKKYTMRNIPKEVPLNTHVKRMPRDPNEIYQMIPGLLDFLLGCWGVSNMTKYTIENKSIGRIKYNKSTIRNQSIIEQFISSLIGPKRLLIWSYLIPPNMMLFKIGCSKFSSTLHQTRKPDPLIHCLRSPTVTQLELFMLLKMISSLFRLVVAFLSPLIILPLLIHFYLISILTLLPSINLFQSLISNSYMFMATTFHIWHSPNLKNHSKTTATIHKWNHGRKNGCWKRQKGAKYHFLT